jgi:Domain of unknown function (DU1801)
MNAKAQLEGFIDRFSPEVAVVARAALTRMRARLPGAIELVYDNYNALAIGFGPTEKASEAPFSITLFPRNAALCFLQCGPALPDPTGILEGAGNQARHIKLKTGAEIETPAVQALIAEALARAPRPFDPTQSNRLVIKSISPKQRPRRPVVKPMGKTRASKAP